MNIEMKILKKAREIITSEDRWTKGFLARDVNRYPVSSCNSKAFCFCAEGAIERSACIQYHPDNPDAGEGETEEWRNYASSVIYLLGKEVNRRYRGGTISVNAWNDDPSTTHKDVLKMFDRTITNYSGRET